METELLYLDNQHLKECVGKVKFFEFTDLVVDKTVFYPTGEGQPNDKGKVIIDGKEYVIVDVWNDGTGVHLMSLDTYADGISGKDVQQIIDWDVRYNHMKFRTALKIISALAYKLYGATTRINQTYEDQAWFDFETEGEITEEVVKKLEDEANKMVENDLPVEISYISREEFTSNEELMKISKGKIPDVGKIRLVKIGDLPSQPDFGTNVDKTGEVGRIEFKTNLVKGKINSRITIFLK